MKKKKEHWPVADWPRGKEKKEEEYVLKITITIKCKLNTKHDTSESEYLWSHRTAHDARTHTRSAQEFVSLILINIGIK